MPSVTFVSAVLSVDELAGFSPRVVDVHDYLVVSVTNEGAISPDVSCLVPMSGGPQGNRTPNSGMQILCDPNFTISPFLMRDTELELAEGFEPFRTTALERSGPFGSAVHSLYSYFCRLVLKHDS